MITSAQSSPSDITAWFTGRLPAEWTKQYPTITIDDEEILVRVAVDAPELAADADESAVSEAVAGRMSAWREETRDARMAIAREAQQRFGRKVSWGVVVGDTTGLFTHVAAPVMTRLRQPERQVLDTLIESGVARSRSDALRWCVRLVAKHTEDWLGELRTALDQVHTVRDQGPDA